MVAKLLRVESPQALQLVLESFGFGTAEWSTSTPTDHALLAQLPRGKFNLQLHVGPSTSDDGKGVFVPTSIKQFLQHAPSRPVLVVPSLIGDQGKDLETLALLARAAFFANAQAFELLEVHADKTLNNRAVILDLIELLSANAMGLPQHDSWFIAGLRQSHQGLIPSSTAVALGLVKEAEVSRALQICNPASVGRLSRLLKSLGLPSKLTPKTIDPLAWRFQLANTKPTGEIQLPTSSFTFEIKQQVPFNIVERCVAHNLTVVPFEMTPTNQHCQVRVPGSKSVSNRALLLAGLSSNECTIHGLLHSDDTQVMMGCLEQFGAKFTWSENGTALRVQGNAGKFAKPTKPLWMGNAGTATRFVISLCALVTDSEWITTMEGSARMMERPQLDLTDALKKNGVQIEGNGFLPLQVRGGGFPGGSITMSGKISSQFVSSVLFAAPYAKCPLELTLEEAEPTSISYIEMTVKTMKEFGVEVERLAINKFRVPNTRGYCSPSVYNVEADASSATYALAMANIIPNRTVKVLGVGQSSVQGDANFCFLMEQMGGRVEQDVNSTSITGGSMGVQCPGTVNMANLTDAFLTATAVGCFAVGKTTIVGIANQHQKECDRILALVTELGKCGYELENLIDGISITGKPQGLQLVNEVSIHTYDDHRIAMSAAVLATRVSNLVIEDKDCTDKTYPEFWDDLERDLKTTVEAHPKLECIKPVWNKQSLVLIGMRGVGKTTLGQAAANAMEGWKFIDLDEVLVKEFSQMEEGENKITSCKEIVDRVGWIGFREWEVKVLKQTLKQFGEGYVISCGGGVVEHPAAREELQRHFPVVHMERDFDEIQSQLEPCLDVKRTKLDDTAHRPTFGEPLEVVWQRREPWFEQCSHYDFFYSLTTQKELVEPLFLRMLENLRHAVTPENVFTTPGLFTRHQLQGKSTRDIKREIWSLRLASPYTAMLIDLGEDISQIKSVGRSAAEGITLSPLLASHALHRGEVLAQFGPIRVVSDIDFPLVYPGKLRSPVTADIKLEQQFYIFGHPTFASNSPTLHNAGFTLFGLQDRKSYCIFDTLSFPRSKYAMLMNSKFTGASVTIPHKQSFFEVLKEISPEARKIGAINTIVKRVKDGVLVGDNTDWLGIRNVLQNLSGSVMIVVGAGGTARAACYCANVLGLELFVYNRTLTKAQELANEFGGKVLALSDSPVPHTVACVVSTIPATSQWHAPEHWLANKQTIVLDAAMRPRATALLIQARALGLRTVEGIEMFMEQGLEQVKRFHCQSIDPIQVNAVQLPPTDREELRRAVMRYYNQ
ncbi:3-phosphoshikimate 1-carboxyvinyltransferase [Batrachochytrium salamandrivorans]|nr:3-phosphoshikimate 1-carboxyvinyltransferase [Batrachochytrium salamandrivorans]